MPRSPPQITRTEPMTNRDFVNTKKPSALKVFWNRHGDSVRFWVIVGLIILTSSVTYVN